MEDTVKYIPVPIDEIDYEQYLPCDIFLNLGSKYIKFYNSQDIPNIQRINKLKNQGIKELYIVDADEGTWLMYNAVKEQRQQEKKEGRITEYTRKTIEKCRVVASQKIERLYSFPLPEEAVEASSDVTKTLLNDLETKPNFIDNFLLTYKDDFTLFEHAYNVATISLSLGKILNLPENKLRNLGIAAVLHDVGKRELSFDYNKPLDELTPKQLEEYKRHPALGAQFLRKGKSLPEDIYVIVFQHHERVSGDGFPQRLKKHQFNELAQIVALANHMDHFLKSNRIENIEKASEYSKYLVMEFLGQHDLVLIKKIATIIAEMADDIKSSLSDEQRIKYKKELEELEKLEEEQNKNTSNNPNIDEKGRIKF